MPRDPAAERAALDRTVKGETVCSLFQRVAAEADHLEALKWKDGDVWRGHTWSQYAALVRDLANGFISLGLQPGEFVNLWAANRPEYYVTDLAVLHAGGVPVSLYNSLAPEQVEYIVNHCQATYIVVENRTIYEKLLALRDRIPQVRRVIIMEGATDVVDPWVLSYDSMLGLGRDFAHSHPTAFEERWKGVQPDGLATLIYTSGTTGPPKGVMVSHYNVVWTAESLHSIMPRAVGARHISYLPLAHIAERLAGHYLQIRGASTCYFCPSPQAIAQYMIDVRPQFFFAVPRIWEKLYYGLTTAIANNPDQAQRAGVQNAIAACIDTVRLEQQRKPVPPALQQQADSARTITAMIRKRVGLDAVESASTGAAPIAAEILEWFHAIGVPIMEVYGQSEDSGPTSWNRPDAFKIGSVGPAVPGVEVRLEEDGELLVRGGNVTRGYYKEPELTAETFDTQGWLHSGDVAEIDAEGFIKIVDRKKEIIITAGGKNIAPSNIENMLKQKPLIGQACVIGDRRPFVSALVVLDAESVIPWAQQRQLPTDLALLAKHPTVLSAIQGYVDEINQHLNNVERVKKFTVLPHEWTADSGELTPTLKMKRKVVNQRYEEAIEKMYEGPARDS